MTFAASQSRVRIASIAALGDAAGVVHFARLIAARHQAEIGADVARPPEAPGNIDGSREGERREMANARNRHQPAAGAASPGHLLHVGVDCRDGRKAPQPAPR